ncbi:acyltransferase family protein [Pseudomonas cannabina]|uniref:Acyltransferase n=4 Tax=Pseudomonas syringae group TaxID=136849 RepID=A0A3M3QPI0_PSECA|nr:MULTISPECIES: acyltransferase [Pseudomonas syringae group]ABA41451.1 putative acyltransferase [Pseudomonas syringae pv. maculicola]KPB77029.1 putative acyltransferase [Pseudomonas syringae pv. maculicola]KPW21505.1 putative acyltransferase [Pseudomonas cannabina pv. alisalensis]MBM0139016.1 acyltransferase [Pseudomonas cannabina pv. alisalensis]QHE96314.1 acyltransferase family protein [Pseudomonas syringae pv. maculicola str. ES4326]
MSDAPRKRVVFLDYMRVFAFVSVLIGHKFYEQLAGIAGASDVHVTIRTLAQMIMPLCVGGAAGVVVFFLTSGYIITYVLKKESTQEFLIKRAFRIYPLFILAVAAQYLAGYWFEGTTPTSVLEVISRILLIGDFTGTPTGLNGVEWTLRIEIMFYIFMATLKSLGFLKNRTHLPAIYLVALTGLYATAPFPGTWSWSFAYVTIYAPLLILGSLIFLAEDMKEIRGRCIALSLFIMLMFMILTAKFIPGWKELHYMTLSVIVFVVFWLSPEKVPSNRTMRFLSELTYSVYLMHNWLWDYLHLALKSIGAGGQMHQLQILIMLLVICYFLNQTIEKSFIALGARLAKHKTALQDIT